MNNSYTIRRYIFAAIIIVLLSVSMFFFFTSGQPQREPLRVGVMDSGYPHPGYVPFQGYDMDKYYGDAVSFIAEEYGFMTNEEIPYDLLGHGNKVISTFVNRVDVPVKIYSAKVISLQDEGTIYAFIQAEKWLIEQQVDLVILSIGATPRVEVDQMGLFDRLHEANIPTIIAAGNTANGYTPNTVRMPAYFAYPNTIVVGAGDEENKASFSSVGKNPDGIPLVDVVDSPNSETFDGYEQDHIGTSFAVPKVAANLVNFMWAYPDLSTSDYRTILLASGSNSGEYRPDIGYGVTDYGRMVDIYEMGTPVALIKSYNGYPTDESYYLYPDQAVEHKFVADVFRYDFDSVSISVNGKFMSENNYRYSYDDNILTLYYHIPVENTELTVYLQDSNVMNFSFDIHVETQTEAEANIYVDYSGLNDLRFAEYGVMTRQMNIFRANNYNFTEGDRVITEPLNLYDYVFSPMFEDRWYEGYEKFSPSHYRSPFSLYYHSNSSLELLFDYVEQGGTWIVSANIFQYYYTPQTWVRMSQIYDRMGVSLYFPNYPVGLVETKGLSSYFNDTASYFYHKYFGFAIEIQNKTSTIPFMGLDNSTYTAVEIAYGSGNIILFGDSSPFIYRNDPLLIIDFLSYFNYN